ncbi:iron complex transport system permease protein [Lipingzhangella halophila]|uniref:Iron complex transport system permease protein n=1 Tax=Lipingzhangella halophila TaxID=1783352 RepID=A0A7W7RG06_9ACTN|nr:iron ABC transporter permease [Lipingzhangella halophila]MBB4931190.1 iron complex transport system permease protein [Lipingzhangella halophila]
MPEAPVPTRGARAAAEREAPRSAHSRMPLALLGLAVALVLAAGASLFVGAEQVAPSRVLSAVAGDGGREAEVLVFDYRLPRTIIAIAVGAALGLAGALIQAFTRNPLADPGILGVNAGATMFVAVAILVGMPATVGSLVWPALAGASFATVAVLLLASTGRGPATPVRMTLAGVALAAVFGGVTTAIRLFDPDTFERYRSWVAGSVAGRSLDDLVGVAPYLIIGLVLVPVLMRPLNAIALGDDLAASLGVSARRTRALAVVAVTLLVGAATAVAGPIGFLGLMAPHVCRLLVGNDHLRVIPMSMLVAPVVLLVSDIVARVVVPLREVPVGVVTAFIGAPVLIWLVSGKQVRAQ